MTDIASSVVEIDTQALKNLIDSEESLVLIDVRTEQEHKRGHLLKSINLPIDQLEKEISSKVFDKDAKVILYCLSGSRSTKACRILQNMGYIDVSHLTNGLLAWRVKQFPIEL